MTSSKFSQGVSNNLKNIGHNVLRGTDVFDCEQLYCLLGLLILEGRVPEESEQGCVPGPHAHYAFSNSSFKSHVCDNSKRSCLVAQNHRERLSEIARRNQTLSIEVWLLPECHHYDNFSNNRTTDISSNYSNITTMQHSNQTCDSSSADHSNNGHGRDGTQFESLQLDCPIQDSFLLVEEWIIDVIPKRSFTGPIQTVTSILKTITSYLHSSNLNNLLKQNHGKLPKNIFYKISKGKGNLNSCPVRSPNYRSMCFPSVGSGESNILTVKVNVLLDRLWIIRQINCDICVQQQQQHNTTHFIDTNISVGGSAVGSKLINSSSVFSLQNKQHVSDNNQDKRRGFTLPLKSTRMIQQITSPMVVYTDQSEIPPSHHRTNKMIALHQHQCHKTQLGHSNSIKDATPYPKYHNLQDLSDCFKRELLTNNNQQQLLQQQESTPINKPRRKSENRIIFTDSSSCESIDQCPSNYVLPISDSSGNLQDTDVDDTDQHYSRANQTSRTVGESMKIYNVKNSSKFLQDFCDKESSQYPTEDCVTNGNSKSFGYCFASSPNFSNSINATSPLATTAMLSTSPSTNNTAISAHNTNNLSSFITFHRYAQPTSHCTGALFHRNTRLPLQSSPAPAKKYNIDKMSCDVNSTNSATSEIDIKSNKSALAMNRLAVTPGNESTNDKTSPSDVKFQNQRNLSSSAPVVSSQKLLVNFEESMLNMRIHPLGIIEGFEVDIGASGSFNPRHIRLPLTTYFFQLSDDNAPSPYLGFVDLHNLHNRRGYQIPKKGSIQLTLFNPNGTVIKMFVVLYNLSDMPANHQTFLRQRTIYMPIQSQQQQQPLPSNRNETSNGGCSSNGSYWSNWTIGGNSSDSPNHCSNHCSSRELPSYLRYLVHLKIHSSKSGKLYLHTDIRLIFSRDKFEFDPSVATYELRSFVDPPPEPRYSPKH